MHWKHFYCLVIVSESARFAGHGTRGGVGGGSVFERMATGARVWVHLDTVLSFGAKVHPSGGYGELRPAHKGYAGLLLTRTVRSV